MYCFKPFSEFVSKSQFLHLKILFALNDDSDMTLTCCPNLVTTMSLIDKISMKEKRQYYPEYLEPYPSLSLV